MNELLLWGIGNFMTIVEHRFSMLVILTSWGRKLALEGWKYYDEFCYSRAQINRLTCIPYYLISLLVLQYFFLSRTDNEKRLRNTAVEYANHF